MSESHNTSAKGDGSISRQRLSKLNTDQNPSNRDPNAEIAPSPLALQRKSGVLEAKTLPKTFTGDVMIDKPTLLSKDTSKILLLTFLYVVQGIPLGLVSGPIQYMMQEKQISYKDASIFSLVMYPYAMKVLWSPVVDCFSLPGVGLRKSWIIPIQIILSISFIALSYCIEDLISNPENIYLLTAIFFVIVTLVATQDIAVDGWAITLLRGENNKYCATCQTVGVTLGFFISGVLFSILSTPGMCETFFYQCPIELRLITLSEYLYMWGLGFLLVTGTVLLFDEPVTQTEKIDLLAFYKKMWEIIKLPAVQKLLVVLLLSRFTFVAIDGISVVKMQQKGIRKENFAILSLIDFPFQLFFIAITDMLIAKQKGPFYPWFIGFGFKYIVCASTFLYLISLEHTSILLSASIRDTIQIGILQVTSSFGTILMFVSMGAFFSKIADPDMGGSYLTLLNTAGNLGGNWPKSLALAVVEYSSSRSCDGHGKYPCLENGDCAAHGFAPPLCFPSDDGYIFVCVVSLFVGVFFFLLSHRLLKHLEKVPEGDWKASKHVHPK